MGGRGERESEGEPHAQELQEIKWETLHKRRRKDTVRFPLSHMVKKIPWKHTETFTKLSF